MPKRYAEESEQDYFAAFDTILMLGNVDMFYYTDYSYSYDLYHYVITKVRWQLNFIKSCLTKKAEVMPVLAQMLDMCEAFHASLYNAQAKKKADLSEDEMRTLATAFLDEMSKPITKLVKTYNIYSPNQYLTELMVRG